MRYQHLIGESFDKNCDYDSCSENEETEEIKSGLQVLPFDTTGFIFDKSIYQYYDPENGLFYNHVCNWSFKNMDALVLNCFIVKNL
jgi:hypothetical protein